MNLSIQILSKELNEYQKDLDKSLKMYEKGDIFLWLHSVHKINLVPKINELKKAIEILQDNKI